MNTNNCPFKIGDRISPIPNRIINSDGTFTDYPSVWPDATVTEITVDGFKYQYDEIFHSHPRLGLSFAGGTCFPLGYHMWKLKA